MKLPCPLACVRAHRTAHTAEVCDPPPLPLPRAPRSVLAAQQLAARLHAAFDLLLVQTACFHTAAHEGRDAAAVTRAAVRVQRQIPGQHLGIERLPLREVRAHLQAHMRTRAAHTKLNARQRETQATE